MSCIHNLIEWEYFFILFTVGRISTIIKKNFTNESVRIVYRKQNSLSPFFFFTIRSSLDLRHMHDL